MGYRDRFDPVLEARSRRLHAWLRFRHRLGLGNIDLVAKLLGVSVRSIQRYEQAVKPPAWYQIALLGLVETFPDRKVARRFRTRKLKRDARGYEIQPDRPPNPYEASRWTKDGEPL